MSLLESSGDPPAALAAEMAAMIEFPGFGVFQTAAGDSRKDRAGSQMFAVAAPWARIGLIR